MQWTDSKTQTISRLITRMVICPLLHPSVSPKLCFCSRGLCAKIQLTPQVSLTPPPSETLEGESRGLSPPPALLCQGSELRSRPPQHLAVSLLPGGNHPSGNMAHPAMLRNHSSLCGWGYSWWSRGNPMPSWVLKLEKPSGKQASKPHTSPGAPRAHF